MLLQLHPLKRYNANRHRVQQLPPQLALLGGLSGVGGGPFYGTGYYGDFGLGLVIIVLLIPLLLGRI